MGYLQGPHAVVRHFRSMARHLEPNAQAYAARAHCQLCGQSRCLCLRRGGTRRSAWISDQNLVSHWYGIRIGYPINGSIWLRSIIPHLASFWSTRSSTGTVCQCQVLSIDPSMQREYTEGGESAWSWCHTQCGPLADGLIFWVFDHPRFFCDLRLTTTCFPDHAEVFVTFFEGNNLLRSWTSGTMFCWYRGPTETQDVPSKCGARTWVNGRWIDYFSCFLHF